MAKETTYQTRFHMIELKKQGLTHTEIAKRLGVSLDCVKKFWRRFLQLGKQGLQRLSRRPPQDHPHQIPQRVRRLILQIKHRHPKWGAQFIQGQLRRQKVQPIPHRRTIERFLSRYPELYKRHYQKRTPLQDPRRARRLHQLWQIDFTGGHRLNRCPKKYSFLNMRDMASAGSILKYTLPAGRSQLTSQEALAVCRLAFTKWGFLPEAIRTDHGPCFVAPERNSFPTDFTLYLWGLGIEHELIAVRCPRQNGGVERDQRTFGEHFLADYPFASERQLVQDAEAFGDFQNRFVPSRSVRCQGKTPWEVIQQLPCRARPYRPKREAKLFDPERIYDRLAGRTWPRLVDPAGYIRMGHSTYYVGRAYRRQTVHVHLDRASKELVCGLPQRPEIKRWPLRGIRYEEIVKDQKITAKQHSSRRSQKAAERQ